MTHRLRLCRDSDTESPEDSPGVFRFPAARVRERLVAGRVDGDPARDARSPDGEQVPSRLRLHRADGREPLPIRVADVSEHIEQALRRVQEGLVRVRDDLEEVLKFPAPGEADDWPDRAA